jgi:hypothetical protein
MEKRETANAAVAISSRTPATKTSQRYRAQAPTTPTMIRLIMAAKNCRQWGRTGSGSINAVAGGKFTAAPPNLAGAGLLPSIVSLAYFTST